jgi:hypothetical protein
MADESNSTTAFWKSLLSSPNAGASIIGGDETHEHEAFLDTFATAEESHADLLHEGPDAR